MYVFGGKRILDLPVKDPLAGDRAAGAGLRPQYRLKKLVLPNEHGAWGILFEPLVAGAAVAWSGTAPFVILTFISAFLMRQPFKIVLADLKAGRVRPHTVPARRTAMVFAAFATFGVVGIILTSGMPAALILSIAAPLAAGQLFYDISGKSRRLLPELLGSVAISSSAAVCAVAAGWSYSAATALSGIFVLRFVPSLMYVRERLKLEKGKSYSYIIPTLSNGIAAASVAALILWGLAPRLTLVVFVILLTRACAGLTRFRQHLRAMQIGVFEVIYGLLLVLAVIIGYHSNL